MQPMPPLHTGDPRVPVDLHSTYQFLDDAGTAED